MLIKNELKQLHKEELVESMRSTVEICNANDPKKLGISSFVTALHVMVIRLDDSLVYENGKLYNEELESLDRDRDNAITGIRYSFLAFTYHKDTAKKAAAQLLLNRLDSYGTGIARMNNETESTVLQNFVNDCKTNKEYKRGLVLIGLQDWIEDIEAANNAFRERYQQRIEKESTIEKTSVTALRPEVMLVYEKLINRINAHFELDETGMYRLLYDQLATLSERYRQIIAIRNHKNTKEVDNDMVIGEAN